MAHIAGISDNTDEGLAPSAMASGASTSHGVIHLGKAELLLRSAKLCGLVIGFIPNSEFVNPKSQREIESDSMDAPCGAKARSVPADLPVYLAALYQTPLLAPEQERIVFRKMNYLKWKAAELLAEHNPKRPSLRRVGQIEQALAEAEAIRNHIIQSNLRLVVANARKFADADHSFDDLISDGNLSLMQAVDKFDYGLGFRFSTYATHAIRRSFFRRMKRRQREKTRLMFTSHEILQEVPQLAADETINGQQVGLYQQVLRRMNEFLSDREQIILRARFQIDAQEEPPTLQELAAQIGICKERVRQLQNRAVEKLREFVQHMESSAEAAVTSPKNANEVVVTEFD